MKTLPLEQQVIWLTGASTGIGEALTQALAGRCKRLYISARNEQKLQQLAAGQKHIIPCPADVTSEQELQMVAARIEQECGQLDMLITNAGTCEYVDAGAPDPAMFRRVMDTNFMGTINAISAALPLLKKSSRAMIAGVSSSVTALAMPRAQAYGASKAAVTHCLQSFAADLHTHGIDVSVISPGFVRTPLTDVNDFPMPCLIEADEAARTIIDGLERRQRDIHFPKRFTLTLRLLGLLPEALRFRISKAMSRQNNNPRKLSS